MTSDSLRDRIASVCGDLGYLQAQTPFSWDLQPTGEIDNVFRVEWETDAPIGGFNFTEERNDRAVIWIAKKYRANPEVAYRAAMGEANSIRAAVIRDGAQISGEYIVTNDGWDAQVQREAGKEFAILRLTIPLNYETLV